MLQLRRYERKSTENQHFGKQLFSSAKFSHFCRDRIDTSTNALQPVADGFHTKKLCSSEPPLGGLEATYNVHLMLITRYCSRIIMSSPVKSCSHWVKVVYRTVKSMPSYCHFSISQACIQQKWLIFIPYWTCPFFRQLNTYLTGHSLLPCYQSAKRYRHSTETAMLSVSSKLWQLLTIVRWCCLPCSIYRQPFECVHHSIQGLQWNMFWPKWSYTGWHHFWLFLVVMAASQLVTRSTRHPVDSSHGQLVTGQLVTRSTRHAVNSSQRGGQLVTSKQTSKHQSRTAAAV